MDVIILHAEWRPTREEAQTRWKELEARMADDQTVDGIIVAAIHNRRHCVMGMLFSDHKAFFAGAKNIITTDIDRRIWMALAQKHAERQTAGQYKREVFHHGEDSPLRIHIGPNDDD